MTITLTHRTRRITKKLFLPLLAVGLMTTMMYVGSSDDRRAPQAQR